MTCRESPPTEPTAEERLDEVRQAIGMARVAQRALAAGRMGPPALDEARPMEHPGRGPSRRCDSRRRKPAGQSRLELGGEQGEDFQRKVTVKEVAERVGHWKCHVCGEQGGVHDMLVARGCNVERATELRRWFDLLSDEDRRPVRARFATLPPAPRRTRTRRTRKGASTLRSPRCGVGRTTYRTARRRLAVRRTSATCAGQNRQKSARGVGDARARRMTFIPTVATRRPS